MESDIKAKLSVLQFQPKKSLCSDKIDLLSFEFQFFLRLNYLEMHRTYGCSANPSRNRPICEICGKKFCQPQKLKTHMKRMHSGQFSISMWIFFASGQFLWLPRLMRISLSRNFRILTPGTFYRNSSKTIPTLSQKVFLERPLKQIE